MAFAMSCEDTFDGDTTSLNIVYSDDSLEELNNKFADYNFYADPRGGLYVSAATATNKLVAISMTK